MLTSIYDVMTVKFVSQKSQFVINCFNKKSMHNFDQHQSYGSTSTPADSISLSQSRYTCIILVNLKSIPFNEIKQYRLQYVVIKLNGGWNIHNYRYCL